MSEVCRTVCRVAPASVAPHPGLLKWAATPDVAPQDNIEVLPPRSGRVLRPHVQLQRTHQVPWLLKYFCIYLGTA